jgi:hypothetical protein
VGGEALHMPKLKGKRQRAKGKSKAGHRVGNPEGMKLL